MGTTVNLDGSESHDEDNGGAAITAYSWTFGSGAYDTNGDTTATPSCKYSTGGTKTVTLTVTDNDASEGHPPNKQSHTHCYVTVYDIYATDIKFDHSSGDSTDGINIRVNAGTDVDTPEWVKDVRNDPAAYKKSTPNVTIQAKFAASSGVTSAKIEATSSDTTVLGNLGEQTVAFSSGVSNYVSFTFASSTRSSVGCNTATWQWKVRDVNGGGLNQANTNSSGPHTIYTVLDTPVTPMAEPWTEVLDYSCVWADGTTTDTGAAGKVTEGIYASGYEYDNVGGAAQYLNDTNGNFELTRCLSEWGNSDTDINCWDCANMVAIFSNSLGCDLDRYYITGSGSFLLNYIKPIGRDWTNDPFTYPGRQGFALHWTGWSQTYDACLQVDDDADPTTSPHTGKQPEAMTFNAGTPSTPYDDYRGKLVDPGDETSVSGTLYSPSPVE